jgi:nitric oxide reductase subunit B
MDSRVPRSQSVFTGSDRLEGIDRLLRWGLLATVVLAVAVLSVGTVFVYRERQPIPNRVVGPSGTTLFSSADVIGGREVFQRTDLMDFGSLYGNGAYFGPDWGSDYLHRQGLFLHEAYARERFEIGRAHV